MTGLDFISIRKATENNLKSVSLDIPRNQLVLVTGVSGSGKSSLVFDVIYREAENRYLGAFSSNARQFLGKMKRPAVEKIDGLSPAIAIDQDPGGTNIRSTVGTMTGIYDFLRLLYARVGTTADAVPGFTVNRSLFSFNTVDGACPACKGLGVEDRLDPALIISDPSKTLREGAMVITTPNGYIIYSQVTMDVLDKVCRSEGFTVDIPWKDLTDEQKHIVLYGSDKIGIPYGKHPLESRMKWSGITAKPREMGYYKGILPVMENILKVDRNKNILRFVRTEKCSSCKGSRLNPKALSVLVNGYSIAKLAGMQLDEMQHCLSCLEFTDREKLVAAPIIEKIGRRIELLKKLGLGYLSCDRDSTSLSGGEARRMRLAVQSVTGLQGVLYIFDEPSCGLHPHDTHQLITLLKSLRDEGNSVIVVEHDEEFIGHCDRLIDIGPGPGVSGGEVILNIEPDRIPALPEDVIRSSETLSYMLGLKTLMVPIARRKGSGVIEITGASENNLRNIHVTFRKQALNVVTGVSGAGKSTLVHRTLGNFIRNSISGSHDPVGKHAAITGWEGTGQVIEIDQSPIGRTPRSNPATYTGLSDPIRDLFASLPEAVDKGFGKSRFSFNTEGGRCESCQGAGYRQIGMHFMGNVEVVCETCNGKRFDDETLAISFNGKNIFDVLEMTVTEALAFFNGQPKITKYLVTLENLGLGYLTLGQRSSTLSGGEAQRVKLAAELSRTPARHTLYILDEPTTGLHPADTGNLIRALNGLVDQGHTVVMIEHNMGMILSADHVIDLGPGSGRDGGRLVFEGTPEDLVLCDDSLTGAALEAWKKARYHGITNPESFPRPLEARKPGKISFRGVTTNNLKEIDIDIPHQQVTVITGVSGSGKSSFAFDTLYSEGQNRFLESFSTYVRSRMGMKEQPDFAEASGLTPTFAVDQQVSASSLRSTAGTMTGIYDLYRLLYSRIGRNDAHQGPVYSSLFSFNHEQGACPACAGLGKQTTCDPDKLVTDPSRSILDGAIDGTKTGKFYGDPYGQYVATMKSAGRARGFDLSMPWNELKPEAQELVLFGTGDEIYDVTWEFKRDKRSGEHHFKGPWAGLCNLVDEEYTRKHADHRGEGMMNVMKVIDCPVCQGTRLRRESLDYTVCGLDIATLSALSVAAAHVFFNKLPKRLGSEEEVQISSGLVKEIKRRLDLLAGMGLSYITIDRVTSTLSGGEIQRIRLAGEMGAGLTGITYVLDEPTAGLHPTDTARLMGLIRNLRDSGNTVVIVEHDRDVILAADHVIEMGPGAGRNGGKIIAEGTPAEILVNPDSIVAAYLKAPLYDFPHLKRDLKPGIHIHNAWAHNLKGFDLDLPSGGITGIGGVSGSGKSTLLFDVIQQSWEDGVATGCSTFRIDGDFTRLIAVNRHARFTGSRGTPATYTGVFDRIRAIFASTPRAISDGIGKNHFSYINREGRCPVCEGEGKIRISMDFMPDALAECEVCKGTRYREEILSYTFKEKSIADILRMTIEQALNFFEGENQLSSRFEMLMRTGLGYLELGQSLDTLSGGESQRLSLATELMSGTKEKTLYLFEEPSNGLSATDVRYLLELFHQLADQGHTLYIIEHDPGILAQADHVIELGPGSGDDGGRLISLAWKS